MKSTNSPLRLTPPDKRITSITEFAKFLGLSYCTVSRAINDHPLVNAETRAHVLRVMDEVGFRPNPLARGLRHRGTGLIGVCFVDLNMPVLYSKLSVLQKFLRVERLHGLLEIADRDRNSEIEIIKSFLQIGVEGIVLVNSTLTAEDGRDLLSGMPAVHADPMEAQEIPSAEPDRDTALRELFAHLLDLGHREFAIFGFNEENQARWPPLRDMANERGLDIKRIFKVYPKMSSRHSIYEGRLMAKAFLAEKNTATAIIALNDEVALGAIQTLRENGLCIPEDISITGFDNLEFAHELHPTITTVDQHPQELMRMAVELLQQQLALPADERGGNIVRRVSLQIIPGESTGPARK